MVVTLLSCCNPVASFFLPKVTRTNDAVIIDFEGSGYAGPIQKKNVYEEIANPALAPPQPFFHPYAMMFQKQQQQHPMVYYGWPYFFSQPSPNVRAAAPALPASTRQDAEEEEVDENGVKQAPVTNATCGRGPLRFPGHHHHDDRTAISERIANGENAKKNIWPFVVNLKNSVGAYFCSGTLVSDSKVLLAAQCLEQLSLLDMSGVTVLIGQTSPTSVQMTRRINKVILHSQYNAANYANDIAILTLDSPVIVSRSVSPVCLPPASADSDQYADKRAILLGWGSSAVTAPNSALQQGKVDMLATAECKSDADIGRFVTDSNICVSPTDEVYSCIGDVGGPVVILTGRGTWTQIGINSYTKDCETVGLKTRVSAYRAWIDLYMQ